MITELGDRVIDSVSGVEGIVCSRTEYLNGCIRCGIQLLELKDGRPQDWYYVDEQQLTIKEKNVVFSSGQKLSDSNSIATGGERPDAPQNY